jgi:hypothetical protein
MKLNIVPDTTIVSTELINHYSMTTAEVQSFMTTLHNQGITTLTVRINAYNEWSSNSNTAISKIKALIPIANDQGISVNVDIHTWYTTWDNSFRDTASNAVNNRITYVNYVKTVVSAFSGFNVNTFMVLNEPQARTASTTENNFILSVISFAQSVTTRPVSVRFMCGYSPSTGHYSASIDQASDFLCRNSYWDPRNPTATKYGTTEAKIKGAITTAHSQNKQLWITEFGLPNTNLTEQQSYVKSFVAYAKTNAIDQIYCWVSQPDSSGESYNIFNGYTPNQAFYELTSKVSTTPPPVPSTFTVNIGTMLGGTTDPTGTQTILATSSLTVVATPDIIHTFVKWTMNGIDAETNPSITIIGTAGQVITLNPVFADIVIPPPTEDPKDKIIADLTAQVETLITSNTILTNTNKTLTDTITALQAKIASLKLSLQTIVNGI